MFIFLFASSGILQGNAVDFSINVQMPIFKKNEKLELTSSFITIAFTCKQVGAIMCSILFSYIVDKIGRLWLQLLSIVGLLISSISILMIIDKQSLLLIMFFCQVCNRGIMQSMYVQIQEMIPSKYNKTALFCLIFVECMTGPFVYGTLMLISYQWQQHILLITFPGIIGLVMWTFAKESLKLKHSKNSIGEVCKDLNSICELQNEKQQVQQVDGIDTNESNLVDIQNWDIKSDLATIFSSSNPYSNCNYTMLIAELFNGMGLIGILAFMPLYFESNGMNQSTFVDYAQYGTSLVPMLLALQQLIWCQCSVLFIHFFSMLMICIFMQPWLILHANNNIFVVSQMVILGSGMVKFISFANLKVQQVPTNVRGTQFIMTDIMNKSGIIFSHMFIWLSGEELLNKMIWLFMAIQCAVSFVISIQMLKFEVRDSKELLDNFESEKTTNKFSSRQSQTEDNYSRQVDNDRSSIKNDEI